ncbi:hypothetical protein DPSP01_012613 [Paraphaeosphaeria sporulosa]
MPARPLSHRCQCTSLASCKCPLTTLRYNTRSRVAAVTPEVEDSPRAVAKDDGRARAYPPGSSSEALSPTPKHGQLPASSRGPVVAPISRLPLHRHKPNMNSPRIVIPPHPPRLSSSSKPRSPLAAPVAGQPSRPRPMQAPTPLPVAAKPSTPVGRRTTRAPSTGPSALQFTCVSPTLELGAGGIHISSSPAGGRVRLRQGAPVRRAGSGELQLEDVLPAHPKAGKRQVLFASVECAVEAPISTDGQPAHRQEADGPVAGPARSSVAKGKERMRTQEGAAAGPAGAGGGDVARCQGDEAAEDGQRIGGVLARKGTKRVHFTLPTCGSPAVEASPHKRARKAARPHQKPREEASLEDVYHWLCATHAVQMKHAALRTQAHVDGSLALLEARLGDKQARVQRTVASGFESVHSKMEGLHTQTASALSQAAMQAQQQAHSLQQRVAAHDFEQRLGFTALRHRLEELTKGSTDDAAGLRTAVDGLRTAVEDAVEQMKLESRRQGDDVRRDIALAIAAATGPSEVVRRSARERLHERARRGEERTQTPGGESSSGGGAKVEQQRSAKAASERSEQAKPPLGRNPLAGHQKGPEVEERVRQLGERDDGQQARLEQLQPKLAHVSSSPDNDSGASSPVVQAVETGGGGASGDAAGRADASGSEHPEDTKPPLHRRPRTPDSAARGPGEQRAGKQKADEDEARPAVQVLERGARDAAAEARIATLEADRAHAHRSWRTQLGGRLAAQQNAERYVRGLQRVDEVAAGIDGGPGTPGARIRRGVRGLLEGDDFVTSGDDDDDDDDDDDEDEDEGGEGGAGGAGGARHVPGAFDVGDGEGDGAVLSHV